MKRRTMIFIWLVLRYCRCLFFALQSTAFAQQESKALERVRLTVPAKSLTFIPYYFGKAQGILCARGDRS